MQKLYEANMDVNVETVREWLSQGSSVDDKDVYDNTLLHKFSALGQPEIVQLLLDAGAVVGAKNRGGETPLYRAGSPEVLKLLIDSGANVFERDDVKNTPLHAASRLGKPETVKLLLDAGAVVNARNKFGVTPLHTAGSLGVLKLLIDFGANVHEACCHLNQTPLHKAAQMGIAENVKHLIYLGCKLNVKDHEGKTPLHLCTEENACKVLIDSGADLEAVDNQKYTPLHCAVLYTSNEDCVKSLLDAHASVGAKNSGGDTPLHLAVFREKIMKLLIDYGADVDAKNDAQMTPLHGAVFCGCKESVKFLIDAGAVVNSKKQSGDTALHLVRFGTCLEGVSKDIIKILLEAGADVSIKNLSGETVLHGISESTKYLLKQYSSQSNNPTGKSDSLTLEQNQKKIQMNLDAIEFLLKHGADPTAKNNRGETPMMFLEGCSFPKNDAAALFSKYLQKDDHDRKLQKDATKCDGSCNKTDENNEKADKKEYATIIAMFKEIKSDIADLKKRLDEIEKTTVNNDWEVVE